MTGKSCQWSVVSQASLARDPVLACARKALKDDAASGHTYRRNALVCNHQRPGNNRPGLGKFAESRSRPHAHKAQRKGVSLENGAGPSLRHRLPEQQQHGLRDHGSPHRAVEIAPFDAFSLGGPANSR